MMVTFGSKKISSAWVKKYLGRRRVGLFFTAGKKLKLFTRKTVKSQLFIDTSVFVFVLFIDVDEQKQRALEKTRFFLIQSSTFVASSHT